MTLDDQKLVADHLREEDRDLWDWCCKQKEPDGYDAATPYPFVCLIANLGIRAAVVASGIRVPEGSVPVMGG